MWLNKNMFAVGLKAHYVMIRDSTHMKMRIKQGVHYSLPDRFVYVITVDPTRIMGHPVSLVNFMPWSGEI